MLAISSTVYDVILSPKAIVEKQEALGKEDKGSGTNVQTLIATGLADILGNVDAASIEEKYADKSSQYKKIATKIDSTTEDAVPEFISENELAGCIYLTPNTKRYYPYSDLAAQVIGFTNEAGGAYGIESQLNKELAGMLDWWSRPPTAGEQICSTFPGLLRCGERRRCPSDH